MPLWRSRACQNRLPQRSEESVFISNFQLPISKLPVVSWFRIDDLKLTTGNS